MFLMRWDDRKRKKCGKKKNERERKKETGRKYESAVLRGAKRGMEGGMEGGGDGGEIWGFTATTHTVLTTHTTTL